MPQHDSEWTNCAGCGKKLKGESINSGFCDSHCKSEFEYAERHGLKGSRMLVAIDDEWINGVWEHITHEPIKITGGRKELIEVCKKHGVMPKALLKPKSRGKGWEMQEKRYG